MLNRGETFRIGEKSHIAMPKNQEKTLWKSTREPTFRRSTNESC